MTKPKIIILTSSLLNDRMILFNNFLPTLAKHADVYLWANAFNNPSYQNIDIEGVHVQPLPHVKDMRFPLQMLRRLNDYAWDAKKLTKSRDMFFKHTREENMTPMLKSIKAMARIENAIGLASFTEKVSEWMYTKEVRSPEAIKLLQEIKPAMLLCMSPFRKDEPGIVAASRKLGIPTLTYITSWDNLTTKNRYMFSYDGYLLWSKSMQDQLSVLYPQSRNKPQYIIGAPQYDIFKNNKYVQTKNEFCEANGLNPDLPIILYTLGSPNLVNEYPGAREFLKEAAKGRMGDIQVVVRAHPLHLNDPELPSLLELYSKTVLQTSNPKKGSKSFTHDENQIVEWVNTFKYSDIVINLASTVAIDAAIFDRPVINLNFDPSGEKDQMVKEINAISDHFAPIAASNGMWEVNNYEEMVEAVNGYLKDPSLHREGRAWMYEFVCGYSDGKCGERFAQALIDFSTKKN